MHHLAGKLWRFSRRELANVLNLFSYYRMCFHLAGELWRFSRRELANVLSLSDSSEFGSTILMLKLFENSVHHKLNKLAASVGNGKAGRRVGGEGEDGGCSEGGGSRGAGDGSWERSSDPGLHEVMKKIDSQHNMMHELMGKVDRQQEAIDLTCALLKRQQQEMQELKASVSHGQSKQAVLEADIQGLPRRQVTVTSSVSPRRPLKHDSPRAGFSRHAARLNSPSRAQQAPVNADLVYAPNVLASLPLQDAYASLPLQGANSARDYQQDGTDASERCMGRSSSNSENREQAVSGALERGISRNLSFYRNRLEVARQMGDADQEAEALTHVNKWEKWLEIRTGSGSN